MQSKCDPGREEGDGCGGDAMRRARAEPEGKGMLVPSAACAMVACVAASNYLAQVPVNDWFTYGSLTYPVTFLITDVTNKVKGPREAKKVISQCKAPGHRIAACQRPRPILFRAGKDEDGRGTTGLHRAALRRTHSCTHSLACLLGWC